MKEAKAHQGLYCWIIVVVVVLATAGGGGGGGGIVVVVVVVVVVHSVLGFSVLNECCDPMFDPDHGYKNKNSHSVMTSSDPKIELCVTSIRSH